MTDAKLKFGNLSLNNQYQVHFAGFNTSIVNYLRNNLGIVNADDFISREMGIMSFYIDKDYTLLRIFEGWMDYITSGAESEVEDLQKPFYRRMRYPDDYKVSSMYISKFEKNLDRALTYQFINAFPKSITPVPVTYGSADLLKVSVSFNYDRYIVNRKRRQPSILSSIFNLFQSSESSTEKYNSNKPKTVDTQ